MTAAQWLDTIRAAFWAAVCVVAVAWIIRDGSPYDDGDL